MAGRFVGFGKRLFDLAKTRGEKSNTIATIVGVAPKVNKSKIAKAVDDVKLTALKARGQMKKRSQDFDRDIQKVKSKLGQSMQKLKNEKVTESGVSKGKDIIKKATGGRVGRRFGSPNPKKTNVQKIKETFAPKNKKLSPKQMKIAKLAGNPNKIDGADFKKLRNK
jgi:hypothetical protein